MAWFLLLKNTIAGNDLVLAVLKCSNTKLGRNKWKESMHDVEEIFINMSTWNFNEEILFWVRMFYFLCLWFFFAGSRRICA